MSGSVYVSSCLIVAIRVGKRRILSRKGNVEEGFAPVRTQAEVTKVTPSFLALEKQNSPARLRPRATQYNGQDGFKRPMRQSLFRRVYVCVCVAERHEPLTFEIECALSPFILWRPPVQTEQAAHMLIRQYY